MGQENKKIIEEMRKYNKELEKHIPGLDDSSLNTSLNSSSIFKTDEDQDEVFTLFAQNLLDLRTEMNLIRRNLSTDIEGMVSRVVNEQQRKFNTRMDNFFVKAILDVKENWASQLGTFSKEINDIKRGFSQMKNESSNVEESINDLKEQFMMLKSVISTMSNKEDSTILIPQIKSLEDKVDDLKEDLDNDFENNTAVEEKLSKLSNSYKALLLKFNDVKLQTDNIDATVEDLKRKNRNYEKKNKEDSNSKANEFDSSFEQMLADLNNLKGEAQKAKEKHSPLGDVEKNILERLGEDDFEVMNKKENVFEKIEKSPSDKIIDIESKISKLSSYK